MSRAELINNVQRYFALRELVDEQTYKKYGDFAWNFFRTELLETLLVLREKIIKMPMTVNNWMYGKPFTERGLRHNMSAEVQKYTRQGKQFMSAHMLGAGIDFVCAKPAPEIKRLIIASANKLPHSIRIEDDKSAPTWVHFDVYADLTREKVTLFSV